MNLTPSELVKQCIDQLLVILEAKRNRRKVDKLAQEHLAAYTCLKGLKLSPEEISDLRKQFPSDINWYGFTPLYQSKEDRDRAMITDLLFTALTSNSNP